MNQKVNSKLSHIIEDALAFEVEVSCENFEMQVNEALDRRESPRNDVRLMEHAADCQACEQILNDYVSVGDSIKLLKGEVAEILARSAQPERKSRLKIIAGVATAALLLLVGLSFIPGRTVNPNLAFVAPAETAPLMEAVAELSSSQPEDVAPATDVAVDLQDVKSGVTRPAAFDREIAVSDVTENRSEAMMLPIGMDIKSAWSGDMAAFNMIGEADWDAFFVDNFGQLVPVLQYSSVFPGVRPVRGTVNMTLQYIRQRLTTPESSDKPKASADPDLGRHFLMRGMIAAV